MDRSSLKSGNRPKNENQEEQEGREGRTVKILLDTHVLVWWALNDKRLSQRIDDQMTAKANEVFVSAATPWEIAIKVRLGKLRFDTAFLADFDTRIRELAFQPLAMTSAHGVAAAQLPGRHKDPFDRMIAAQAATEQLALVSTDPAFKVLGVPTVW